MSVLDRVREKYGSPREGADKSDKSPSVSFVSPKDRDSESFPQANAPTSAMGFVLDFDREKARRDAQRRAEAKRKRLKPVLKMMAEDDETRDFCLVTDDQSDPNYVFLSFVIRGKASGEMTVLQEEYDGLKLLAVLEKVAGEVRGNK